MTTRRFATLATLLATSLAAHAARAQPPAVTGFAAAPDTSDTDLVLPFITRGAHSFADLRADRMIAVSSPMTGTTNAVDMISLELSGQWVDPSRHLGVYGALGGARAAYADGGSATRSAIDGLELGGLYVVGLAPETNITFQAGVVLPTGPGTMSDAVIVPMWTALYAQPADLARSFPEAWGRVGVTPSFRVGDLIGAAHLGIDQSLGGDLHGAYQIVNGAAALGVIVSDRTTFSAGVSGYTLFGANQFGAGGTGVNGGLEMAENFGSTQVVGGLSMRLNDGNPSNEIAAELGVRRGF